MFVCWGNACCTLDVLFYFIFLQVYVQSLTTRTVPECARPCQFVYLMLRVGNVHLTVINYEKGVRGAVFWQVLTAEVCFFKPSEPPAVTLHPAACRKLPLKQSWRGQEVTAQQRNGMFLPGSRSSLQSQRGPEIIWEHRHMLHLRILLPTSLHFHLAMPASLITADFAVALLYYCNCSNECFYVAYSYTYTSYLNKRFS